MTAIIKCKEDTRARTYEDATIAYIDNGDIRFVNITDSRGWTNSYRINDIERLELR